MAVKASCTLAMLPLLALLSSPAGAERSRRLPAGYHQGRCLYVVDGKQRIAGRCYYTISKGGGFHIDGPRQVYGGVDTVDRGSDARTYSRDWWADVFKDDDGSWTGYGNEESIGSVHGEGPMFGPMRREGACFVGERAKVCLWRE
jgi:hypothetical protein